jgi:hypothetical protein
MRSFAATLLVGALVCSQAAHALDCGGPSAWHYHPRAADGTVQAFDKIRLEVRKAAEARALLERLERTAIIFRARIVSARDLSDLNATNVPWSLTVFENVEILKGRLPPASRDRRAFLLQRRWCDFRCGSKASDLSPSGETVVVAAGSPDRSRAVDDHSNRVVYNGRIDALITECGMGRLSPLALELLSAPADEIARLKREYPPRPFN